MRHLLRTTIFALSLVSLAAWGNNHTRSGLEPKALIPLSVGNSWSYQRVGGDATASAKVLKSESRGGASWFLYKEFGDVFWLKNEEGNQVEAVNAFDKFDLPEKLEQEVVFYSPAKAPAAYSSSGGSIQYRSCEKSLKVPAGIFPCHVYTIDLGEGNSSVNYYSPGVGLIRNEFTTDSETVIFELTDYRVE